MQTTAKHTPGPLAGIRKVRTKAGCHCQMASGEYRYFAPGRAIPEYDLGSGYSAVRHARRGSSRWMVSNGSLPPFFAPTLRAAIAKATAA